MGKSGGEGEHLAKEGGEREVVLTTPNGDGKVYGQVRQVGDHGYFTLRQGEGTLAGLHAVGRIEWLEGDTFSLEGTYHLDPH